MIFHLVKLYIGLIFVNIIWYRPTAVFDSCYRKISIVFASCPYMQFANIFLYKEVCVMNFKKIFKKILTVSAVVGVLATGSVITGYAGYVKVGNTIERFSLSKKDATSIGCGYLPACTQVDQTESYVTIFNGADHTEGYAYATSTGNPGKIFGYKKYYIAKNCPSPYTSRYKDVARGRVAHYWTNTGGGGFRTNLTVYRYTK